MNPLFNGSRTTPFNNLQNMMARFNQFKQTVQGDPRQQIQKLMESGKITQEQFDNAVKQANEIMRMFR